MKTYFKEAMSKTWWKHGRYAMCIYYDTVGHPYYVLEKSLINENKRTGKMAIYHYIKKYQKKSNL